MDSASIAPPAGTPHPPGKRVCRRTRSRRQTSTTDSSVAAREHQSEGFEFEPSLPMHSPHGARISVRCVGEKGDERVADCRPAGRADGIEQIRCLLGAVDRVIRHHRRRARRTRGGAHLWIQRVRNEGPIDSHGPQSVRIPAATLSACVLGRSEQAAVLPLRPAGRPAPFREGAGVRRLGERPACDRLFGVGDLDSVAVRKQPGARDANIVAGITENRSGRTRRGGVNRPRLRDAGKREKQ